MSVRRGDLSLSKRLVLILGLVTILCLALAAHASAHIYWTNEGTEVGRAEIDGSGPTTNSSPAPKERAD